MKESLRDTLSSSQRIGTKISLNALREIFRNPDILDEMLDVSLEGGITPESKEKIKSVINHIL
jgi:hypothetical protein